LGVEQRLLLSQKEFLGDQQRLLWL
jgi:hypothetical protein